MKSRDSDKPLTPSAGREEGASVRRPQPRQTGHRMVSVGETGRVIHDLRPDKRQANPNNRFTEVTTPTVEETQRSATEQLQSRLDRLRDRRPDNRPPTATLRQGRRPVIWKRKTKSLQYRGVPSLISRHGRQKVYRLKGYTTIARVNRKRRRERMRYHRNQVIIWSVIILAVILFFLWLDPIPKIREFFQVIGYALMTSTSSLSC